MQNTIFMVEQYHCTIIINVHGIASIINRISTYKTCLEKYHRHLFAPA
jgi:hypothetical protein